MWSAFTIKLALGLPLSSVTGAGLTVAGPPTAWRVSGGSGYSSVLLRSEQTLTRVGIVHSDLTEEKTRAHLNVSNLYLTPLANNCALGVRSVDLPANQLVPARLCVTSPAHGAFSGSIRIAPAGGDPSPAIATTIYLTSTRARVAGTLLLAIGALLAFFVTRVATNGIARAQALLPIALLRERLQPALASVRAARLRFPGVLTEMSADAGDLQNRLSASAVDAALFVPPRFPVFGTTTLRSSELSAFIATADVKVTLLGVLSRAGVQGVLDLAVAAEPDVRKALVEVDNIWVAQPSAAEALRRAREVVLALKATIPVLASVAPSLTETSGGDEATTGKLLPQVRRFSAIAFSLVTLGTILAGWASLIAANPGFGLPADYVTCFTTGFVVPTVAGMIASPVLSNTTSVAVSRPRPDF